MTSDLDCFKVAAVLGFEPKKVVVSGESSGGNLTAAMAIVLNDIRRSWPEAMVRMPTEIVLIYPRSVARDLVARSEVKGHGD